MTDEYDLTSPDRFTVDAIGPVGQRVFLMQCRQGGTVLTVKVEKSQVAVLASYLARIVRELGQPGHVTEELGVIGDIEPDWAVGTIGVSYDEDSDRLMVVAEELVAEDEDGGAVARIAVTREQAAAFAIRATQLVESGRPPCPLCGLPLDPSGHDCPRTNGHRPPVT
jgi:uncharacterized repeat protein (TIGR03847 family)